MIVLDANVLIGFLTATDAHHDRADALFAACVDDDLAISPVTLAEVLVGPTRTDELGWVTVALRALELQQVRWQDDAPEALARLRVSTGLRLPDCAVLLAAQQIGGIIATFDDRLAAAARRTGIQVSPG